MPVWIRTNVAMIGMRQVALGRRVCIETEDRVTKRQMKEVKKKIMP